MFDAYDLKQRATELTRAIDTAKRALVEVGRCRQRYNEVSAEFRSTEREIEEAVRGLTKKDQYGNPDFSEDDETEG